MKNVQSHRHKRISYHARGPMYKYTSFDMVHNGAINTAAIFQCSTDIALFACSPIDIYIYILGTVFCRFCTIVNSDFGDKNDRCLKSEKCCSITTRAAYNV